MNGPPRRHAWATFVVAVSLVLLVDHHKLHAAEGGLVSGGSVDINGLLRAGGVIGLIIIGLSIAMVALIVEHLISIRRSALIPGGVADQLQKLVQRRQWQPAAELCRSQPSFLTNILAAGIKDVDLGFHTVEKAMEDASAEQAARLFRKIEYLSVIGTLAPMLGLMGTVWGMIQAFSKFSEQAAPPVAELAPGISSALVTTLMGLSVTVPALAAFAFFRNRIDEYVAESSLVAEEVMAPYKRRMLSSDRDTKRRRRTAEPASKGDSSFRNEGTSAS